MNTVSVAECEKQFQSALEAAKRATTPADRKRSLDRAAVFAHLSEQARMNAEAAPESPVDVLPFSSSDRAMV